MLDIPRWQVVGIIAKLQSMLEQAEHNGSHPQLARELVIGKGYCHHAANRINHRLKGLFHNRDKRRLAVADAVLGSADDAHQ